MKKPKFNLGEGGWKGFLLLHVEKLVLGVVAVLVGVFIYAGYQREGYSKGDPADLKRKADEADSYVKVDHSIQLIARENRDKISDYPALVDKSRRPISANDYSVPILDPPRFPPTRLRQDPQLFAAEKIEVEPLLVAVYEVPDDSDDPWKDDKSASMTKKAGATKKKNDNKGGGSPGSPSGAPGAMPGAMPGGSPASPAGAKGGSPKGGKAGGAPVPGGGDDDVFGGGAMPGMPGMGGPGPGMGGGGGANLSAGFIERYIHGFRPGGLSMGGPGGPMGNMGNNSPDGSASGGGARPVSRYMMAIKAVIPHKKIHEEYQRVFAEAQGYDPTRDAPSYVYFYVERAEVGNDPNAPPQWKRLNTKKAQARMEAWGGLMPEVADAMYLDPILSMSVPPALMVDPARLALHSEIPRATAALDAANAQPAPGQKRGAGEGDETPDGPGGDVPGGAGDFGGGRPPGGPGAMPGAMPGGPRGGMPGGAMPGAMPGGPRGGMPGGAMPGAMPGGPRGGMPGGAMPGAMPGGPRGGMPGGAMPGAMPGGAMPGGGMGGGMDGMGMAGTQYEVPKNKLIRFFDFEVEPGKKYRYRIQVLIEDPNHPREEGFEPDPRSLSTAVAQRVKQAEEADAAKKARTFWRETEWSEPSSVVTLPESERFVAGEVLAGRSILLPEQKAYISIEEPSATVLPIHWDTQRAAEIPGYADKSDDPKVADKPSAYRGSVLTFRRNAKVVKPDTLEIREIEKFDFRSGAVVVDMRAAEPVRDGDRKPGEKKEPAKSSGEVLLLDRQGRFIVRNELEDDEDYTRMMLRGEEQPAAATTGGSPMGGGPGAMPGAMPGGAPGSPPGPGGGSPGSPRK